MTDTVVQTKNCLHCQSSFSITQRDLAFYDTVSPTFVGQKFPIPTPTLCPACRQRRRMAFRNERSLYRRTCDASGKQIISAYSPDKPYKVYDYKIWRSDSRDPMDYGRDFDFSKTFTEQFDTLRKEVPMLSLNVMANENADYMNYSGYSKSCYLSFNTDYSENTHYSTSNMRCHDSMDLLKCVESTLCYDCIDATNCYNLFWSQFCFDCHDSCFLFNCRNCSFCFGCENLENQSYYIYNKKVSPEAYTTFMQSLSSGSHMAIQWERQKFYDKVCPLIEHEKFFFHADNCSGKYIFSSRNVHDSYDMIESEDCSHCQVLNHVKDCYDRSYMGYEGSRCYELSCCGDTIHHCVGSHNIRSGGINLLYCALGSRLSDCFGCIGLRHKQYCIFNKQYSKEDYELTVAKIISHMQDTGERWEFLHPSLSPFGYDETLAQEYAPTTHWDIDWFGYKWNAYQSPNPVSDKVIQGKDLPDSIDDVQDDLLQYAIACVVSGKLFRVQSQELAFYRKHHIPLPRKHPDQRHLERLAMRK